ncbi:MAG: LamG domain-containing protein [Pirellulaceae bacterium]
MADAFNAYHVWLGIPPKDQPPHHYRLLGLELFEDELGVIENAADRQMGHVRRHQSGRHSALSQQILNEISAARVCLLSAERKQAYDAELRAKLAPSPPPVPVGIPVAAAIPTASSPTAPPPLPETTTAPPKAPPPRPAPAPARSSPARSSPAKPESVATDEPHRAKSLPWNLIALWGGVAGLGGFLALALLVTIVLWLFRDSTIAETPTVPTVAQADADGPPTADEAYDPEADPEAGSIPPPEVATDPPPPTPPKAEPPPSLPEPFALREMASSPVDLLAAIDPANGAVRGTWNRRDDGPLEVLPPDPLEEKLLGTRAPINLLAAPIAPPKDYRLKLIAVRRSGLGGLGVGLVFGDAPRQVLLRIDEGGVSSGVEGIDGKSVVEAPLARRATPLFAPDKETQLVLEVVDDQVTVTAGALGDEAGETVFQWQGDAASLSPAADWTIPHDGALYLAVEDAGFEILALELSRVEKPAPPPTVTEPPAPLARWTFNEDLRDEVGEMHGAAQGGAKVNSGRLWLDGSSFVVTAATPLELTEKTLEVWLTLAALDQREGGVMSIAQGAARRDLLYDALVFAAEPARTWQAVGQRRRRLKGYDAAEETAADRQPVHLAVVYHVDGTVSLYRNGKPYAEIVEREVATFHAGEAQIAFGRRSPPADGLLVGSIDQAQLFDRALTAEQIATLAGIPPTPPTIVAKELADVPADADLAPAHERVRQAYKDEIASAKNPAQKQLLAEKLLRGAEATTSDLTGRYALLVAARDAFAQAGDLPAAFSVIDRMADDYRIEVFTQQSEVLPVAARIANAGRALPLAEGAREVAEQAVRRDDFETARQALQIAHAAARQARATTLIRDIGERQKQIGELAEKFSELATSRETLAANPDDPQANLAVGMYHCFVRDDWANGLAHLAKGGDESLRTLALLESDAPADPGKQVQLGDGWWDASAAATSSESAPTIAAVYLPAMQRRAMHWYRLAVPHLEADDLGKLVAERRLREYETAQNDGWRVIFRGGSPALWNTKVDNEQAFAVPLDEVADTIKFLRLRRTDTGQLVILPITKELLASGGLLSQNLMWTTSTDSGGVPFLGAAAGGLPVSTAGQPYLGTKDKSAFGGWGFGGLWQDAAGRSFSWAGQLVTDAELEISVKSEALSVDEAKLLIR